MASQKLHAFSNISAITEEASTGMVDMDSEDTSKLAAGTGGISVDDPLRQSGMNYAEVATNPPLVDPRYNADKGAAATDDYDEEEVAVTAEEATIPVVDDVVLVPTGVGLQAQQAEERAAAAEVERLAAERRLADHQRTLCQRMAELSKMQRGVVFGLMLLIVGSAATALVICRSGKCSTTTSATPAVVTTMKTATLSPRAKFIVDFINNITLTGRTILYPDTTTPEGRALSWLIDDDEQKPKSNGTFVVMDRDHDDKVSLQQRYVLATLCFQSPTYFDSARPVSANNKAWATAIDECEWDEVICNSARAVEEIRLEEKVFLHGGHISDDLGLLTALTALDLTKNRLVGTIPSSLVHLTSLNAQNNALTGTISSEFGTMTSLLGFSLSENELHGTIPSELDALTKLNLLVLDRNRLTGTIPSSLGALRYLNAMDLSVNRLNGTIPSSLWAWTGLEAFALYENRLSGTIPSWLAMLSSLKSLALHNNTFTGTIPSSFGSLGFLTSDKNGLAGTIPSALGSLLNLKSLEFADNALTGTTPSSLGALTGLDAIQLYNNRLNGTIPSSLGTLTAVKKLYLFDNALSGSIPSELGQLTALQAIHVDYNQLTGTIPSSLATLTALTEIWMTNNRLTGTIPTWLSSLPSLQELALANNTLTGTIPASIGTLTALTDLRLFLNSFTGTIPSALGGLTSLRTLNFRGNGLTGTIPSSLTTLTALTALYLYDNQITGPVPFCDNVTSRQLLWSIQELVADCDKVDCPCCTHCCPAGGWNGIQGFEKCGVGK
jgi:Leucine-rich repeat (LRR) protein